MRDPRTPILPLLAVLGLPWMAPSSVLAAWPSDATSGNVPLCTAPFDQTRPNSVPDGAGGAIVVWQDHRNGANDDIYAQRVSASGVPLWGTDGVAICTAGGDQDYPTLIADGAGGAIITWYDSRTSGTAPDIYAQRVSAAGGVQWTADGVALCVDPGLEVFPTIVPDGAGGAIVAWQDHRGATASDIYAQRISAAGVPLWSGGGVAVCKFFEVQARPKILADDAGGAFITWLDYRPGGGTFGQRVDAAGVPQWTANGLKLSNYGSLYSVMIGDGAGGVILTGAGSSVGLWAQRVSGAGTPLWGADGVTFAPTAAAYYYPNIPATLPDGAGGALVAWQDFRSVNSAEGDIYAQRLDASGTPQWAANGVVLCSLPSNQINPTITSDGAGGAIVTWQDLRDGVSDDIYAQRLDSSGVAQWAANGVPIALAVNEQTVPVIVSDDHGGAIMAWTDYRNGATADIYAQRIPHSGVLGDNVVGVRPPDRPVEVALGPARPNPARSGAEFRLALPRGTWVRMALFDAQGRQLRQLVNGVLPAGEHPVRWDGRDDAGRPAPNGLYFCRLEVEGRTLTRRLAAIH